MQNDVRLRLLASVKDLPSLLAAIHAGARPSRDGDGVTLLMFVVSVDWAEGFDAILPYSNIEDVDNYGWTALDWAVLRSGGQMIEKIVEAGSKPMLAGKSMRQSLRLAAEFACSQGKPGTVAFIDKLRALLSSADADPWAVDDNGRNLFKFLENIGLPKASLRAEVFAEQQALSRCAPPKEAGASLSLRI